MASLKKELAEVRERGPVVAHLLRMVSHYGTVQANLHAGAITFFGFLSLFPLLALTFFAVGLISSVYPEANEQIRSALESAAPGLIGGKSGISLTQVRSFSGWAGVAGLVGVLFTGLGFIQVLRTALMFVFERPLPQDSFPRKKLADLLGLLTVGGTAVVSVVLGSVLSRVSGALLDLVGLDDNLSWLLVLLGVLVGFGANLVLFYVMFRQLGRSTAPPRALWSGALLGAIGFEIIKQLSTTLIGLTEGKPAFQAFGIALVVVVLFNYFARVTLYAACWAHTSPSAIAARPAPEAEPVQGPQVPSLAELPQVAAADAGGRPRWVAPFAAGGAAMLALVAVVRRKDS